MIKIFNSKTKIVYIALILVFAVLGSALIGVNVHYKKAFTEATKTGNDLTDKAVNVITNLLQGLLDKTGSGVQANEQKYSEEALALKHKQNLSFGFMIASYCLTAVFAGMAIAASEYPKYLEGDKYKAKMKRLEKAKKAAQG